METFRGFIAIDVPLTPTLKKLIEQIQATSCNIKLVEPENIHITLKFLGETQIQHLQAIQQIMTETVKGVPRFSISLKGTGVFPNENYIKVVWIGIEHTKNLEFIAQELDAKLVSLGYKKEKRKFSAHLTLGRMRSAKAKEEIVDIIQNTKELFISDVPVKSIKLKKSTLTPHGPIYETLVDTALGADEKKMIEKENKNIHIHNPFTEP